MKIESERLILRSWEEKDIDAIVDGLNHLEVSKWLSNVPYPYTKEDAKAFLELCKIPNPNHIRFAIVLKDNNKVIGGTELTNIDKKNGLAGGGIWINLKYQGNGYGAEAFKAKIRYAFYELGLRRMENGYFPENEASRIMQENLGYKVEGIRRKRFYSLATKEYMDEVITGLLKEEFVDEMENRYKEEKFIRTNRLFLQPASVDDVYLLLKMDQQPETQFFLGGVKERSKEEGILFIEEKIHQVENGLLEFFTVFLEDNTPIGFIELKNMGERSAIISYIFDYDYWDHGYCTEACLKLLPACFEKLNLEKITASVVKDNVRSRRVLDKTGFLITGERQKDETDFIDYEYRI